ncbi:BSD domain-containing [Cryptosporidium sp. chipmunk genotype I]|uniref:BSD domain-containing n=1 Tax=Cryptosporidium sp. chipmunk genotype I TaxID=1280935 RepID=UPI00351A9CE9|nr:BSD domain-containing [Cryptosporidium sp. chipmunk genotype I]
MGIVESVEDLTQEMELEMKDFDETMQDNVFPWFHIVQWSSEELPTNTVLKWNYKSIKEKVQSLTLNKQVFLTNCPISRIQGFSLDEDNPDCIIPFAEWAAALLSQMDDLNNIRYELVPRRMSESIFWQSYFNAIRNIIIKDVIISIENQNALVSNATVPAKKYKEINENEISEENVPDFYKSDIIYSNNTLNAIEDTNIGELKFKIESDEHRIDTYSKDLNASTGIFNEIEQGKSDEQDLEKEHRHQSQEQDQHELETDTETTRKKELERKIDNELYIQDNYIYGDKDVKLYDNNDNNSQLDREINDIYTNQMDNNPDHQLNSSDCEQETNDFNNFSNIDDHDSTLFSEEIPINQE